MAHGGNATLHAKKHRHGVTPAAAKQWQASMSVNFDAFCVFLSGVVVPEVTSIPAHGQSRALVGQW